MALKTVSFAILMAWLVATAAQAAPVKAPALKEAPLLGMHDARMTMRDVIVARYTEEPATSGMFRFFRKMTVVDNKLTDRELYIMWLSRDEALPKVGAHCDIRYHMGSVGGVLKPEATDATGDSRIMDDFVCKPVGKT